MHCELGKVLTYYGAIWKIFLLFNMNVDSVSEKAAYIVGVYISVSLLLSEI